MILRRTWSGPCAAALILLALATLGACKSTQPEVPAPASVEADDADVARERIAHARELAERGRLQKAIRRLQRFAEDEDRPSSEADSELYFTIGWLYGELGSSPEGGEPELLEAEAWYRRAIDLPQGGHRAGASYNLAVVLRRLGRNAEAREYAERAAADAAADPELAYRARILAADLAMEAGDGATALALARSAYDSDPEAEDAPPRLLLLLGARDATGALVLSWSDLVGLGESFAEHGHARPAVSVFGALLNYGEAPVGVEPGQSRRAVLDRWLELQARLGSLTPESLEDLPEEWPDAALAQVRELVMDPTRDSELGEWRTSRQRRLIALALQSMAGNFALEREPRRAEIVYRRALAIAPRPEELGPEESGDVGTATAIDLVLLYHGNPSLLEFPDYPSWFATPSPAGEKLVPSSVSDGGPPSPDSEVRSGEHVEYLPRSDSQLGSFGFIRKMWPTEAAFEATRERLLATDEGRKELVEFHSVLGLVFYDIKRWRPDDWLHSPLHLLRAIDVQRESFGTTLPYLRETLGDGQKKSGRPEYAVLEYRRAAREYLDIGARDSALRCLRKADELYDETHEDLLAGLRAVEDVIFPQHGWYVGGAAGWVDLNRSSGDLLEDLLDDGEGVSNVDLDDTRSGAKGYVGYRFDGPWALELGYTSLEGPNSSIQATASPTLLHNIEREHPVGGEGPTFAVLCHPFTAKRWSVSGKLGVWYWDSKLDVDLNGSRTSFPSDHGFDPFFGIGTDFAFSPRVSFRVEVERYFIDDEDIDFLSFGGFLKF